MHRKCIHIILGLLFGGIFLQAQDITSEYTEMPDTSSTIEHFEWALAAQQQKLRNFIPAFTDTSRYTNPSVELLETCYTQTFLQGILADKGEILQKYYQKTGKTKFLKNAYETFELVNEVTSNIAVSPYESTRLFEYFDMKNAYANAIQTAITISKKTNNKNYLEQAFQWAERSKLLFLKRFKNDFIPDSLKKQEWDLKAGIQDLEMGFFLDSLDKSTIQPRINRLKGELAAFNQRLKQDFPDYFKAIKIPSLNQIRNKILKDETVLLKYFVSEKATFLFEISKNDIQIHELKSTYDEMLEWWRNVDEFIKKSDGNTEQYIAAASNLYEHLLPISTPKNCIIIPDFILVTLPFEALLTSKPTDTNFKTLPYLLREKNISYSYSATQLLEQYKGLPVNIGKQFLGITDNQPNNRDEVHYINRKLKGEVLQDSTNLKADFKKKVKNYDIIHLAVDIDTLGNLLMGKDVITPLELSQQDFDVSMFVMNSSSWADFKLEQILNSKTESIIFPRWRTDRATSKDIMQRFYANLGEKMSKSASLRQAKLDYLTEDYVNEKMAHPYYWAAWSPYGNMSPLNIQIKIENFIGLVVGLILILLIIAYFLRKNSPNIPVSTITNIPARG